MYNLLISLAAALVAFFAFFFAFGPYAAILPTVAALGVTYFLLARRSLRQLETILLSAQRDLGAKRIEPGLARIREGFPIGRWQFLVTSQVHAQLGMILYMLQRFDEARPHLEKSFVRVGQARAMLAALHFQKKDYPGMIRVFEEAVRHSKKDGFLWSIYAWCLDKSGNRDGALAVLARGLEASAGDEKLKMNQLALQNEKRMKMKAYGQEWWAFHLERPPPDLMAPGFSGGPQHRKGYRARKQ